MVVAVTQGRVVMRRLNVESSEGYSKADRALEETSANDEQHEGQPGWRKATVVTSEGVLQSHNSSRQTVISVGL